MAQLLRLLVTALISSSTAVGDLVSSSSVVSTFVMRCDFCMKFERDVPLWFEPDE